MGAVTWASRAPQSVGYHGDDRRAATAVNRLPGRPVVLWAAVGMAAMLCSTMTIEWISPRDRLDLWPLALAVWCALTLSAGVGLLIVWWVGGWARPAMLGATFLSLGSFAVLGPRLSEATSRVAGPRHVRSLGVAVLLTVAVVETLRSVRRADVDTSVRPGREIGLVFGVMTACVLASVGLVSMVLDRDPMVMTWPVPVVCWAGALLILAAGRPGAVTVVRALAASWALLGVAALIHASGTSGPAEVAAATLLGTSAVVVLVVAVERVKVAVASQHTRGLRTLATLAQANQRAGVERERRHDALNALSAIRSAAEVLAVTGSALDQKTRDEIRQAAWLELIRVERMLAPAGDMRARDVALDDLLAPVFLTWSQRGVRVRADLTGTVAYVVPDALIRIVENLLQNAARHAAGAPVQVRVERCGAEVWLSVIDSGPGIDASRRNGLFADTESSGAGERSGEGHGLGLASARRLARLQGGDLRLVSGERGCWFVVTMPMGRGSAAASTAGLGRATPVGVDGGEGPRDSAESVRLNGASGWQRPMVGPDLGRALWASDADAREE